MQGFYNNIYNNYHEIIGWDPRKGKKTVDIVTSVMADVSEISTGKGSMLEEEVKIVQGNFLNYVRVPRRRTAPDRANIASASARRPMLGPPTNDADQADVTSPSTS